jgi:alpha-amylase
MRSIIPKSICKLFVFAVVVTAGSVFSEEEGTPSSDDPTAVSLTVKEGKPSGRYTPGTRVTVRADAPPSGTRFTGWKGDVQILADRRSPTTTAIVPFTPVTVTATYGADSQDPATLTAGAAATTARDQAAEMDLDELKDNAPNDRGDRQGAGVRGAGHSLRAPVTDETFYFLMADRFENGSTANDLAGLPDDRMISGFDPTARGFYHGGDLRGIINRLDYIKALGTTAIWLTPSFKNRPVQPQDGSAGYHGYWITDFTQIDPHLGTNAELAELVDKAHRAGMKVFFDIITNHTADIIQYREGARTAYVSKDERPYTEAGTGIEFDDRDFAGTSSFPAMNPETSFPYHPVVPEDLPRKVPEWLNDVTLYHNRGDTTFTGAEDPLYGDFFGLDDLFTEHPRVVRGMIDIYKTWVRDFRIDGFRIDTMKHVNDELWQQFGPEVLAFARQQGLKEFFMFGEVFDLEVKAFTARYTTRAKMQSVLDFAFQARAQDFAANSGPTSRLQSFFEDDDLYTDADSNVYQLPTFLGNHDIGRIGRFVSVANPGASDEELFMRDRLAHELMYLSRGNPVIYYGDEQGFTGDGGDQLARQDMFPSRVAEYNDDDLIGTDATTAESNFDRQHPLFQSIAKLAALTKKDKTLRNGAQQHRYATDGPGIYAFSRIGLDRSEYVVAFNNSEQIQTATIRTFADGRRLFVNVYGDDRRVLLSDREGNLSLSVPPLSAVVYELAGKIPLSRRAPSIAIASVQQLSQDGGRLEVRADVGGDSFYEVTFQARTGDGEWKDIGTDDNRPFRVFHDVSALPTGTALQYRAFVLDNAGHTRRTEQVNATVPAPLITLSSPENGRRVRTEVQLLATTDPDRPSQSVRFERRVPGGDWTTIGLDTSSPAYTFTDSLSGLGLAEGDQVDYRAVLIEAGGNEVASETRSVVAVIEPITSVTIHYLRPEGDYGTPPNAWGLHLFGEAIADEVLAQVQWTDPWDFTAIDQDGARFEVPLKNDEADFFFIVHLPGRDDVPTGREPGGDRRFVPLDHPEVWLLQGDPNIYFADPTP